MNIWFLVVIFVVGLVVGAFGLAMFEVYGTKDCVAKQEIKILNIVSKKGVITGKLIYKGPQDMVDIVYERSDGWHSDWLRIIIFDENKNIVYARKFQSKNIEIHYL